MRGGGLSLGLVVFMLLGGIYSLAVDRAWLGGGVWTAAGLILLPPVQSWLAERWGLRLPPLLSIGILVCGFLTGLILLR